MEAEVLVQAALRQPEKQNLVKELRDLKQCLVAHTQLDQKLIQVLGKVENNAKRTRNLRIKKGQAS